MVFYGCSDLSFWGDLSDLPPIDIYIYVSGIYWERMINITRVKWVAYFQAKPWYASKITPQNHWDDCCKCNVQLEFSSTKAKCRKPMGFRKMFEINPFLMVLNPDFSWFNHVSSPLWIVKTPSCLFNTLNLLMVKNHSFLMLFHRTLWSNHPCWKGTTQFFMVKSPFWMKKNTILDGNQPRWMGWSPNPRGPRSQGAGADAHVPSSRKPGGPPTAFLGPVAPGFWPAEMWCSKDDFVWWWLFHDVKHMARSSPIFW